MMRSTYSPEDVTILLKDITGLVEPLPAAEREKKIQSGTHYCEMLPLEYKPSPAYMQAYERAKENYAAATAEAAACLAEKLYREKGDSLVLVSLARAGIPVGILLRRFLKKRYGMNVSHYAVSIIRGRGMDPNAMKYILKRHRPEQIQFVDGWIGKGAILGQLKEAMSDYPGVASELAVLSDPAGLTRLYGTREDILIPSSCLNAVVTGLISRTFLRSDIIGEEDFHGAVYYQELEPEDLSEEFLQSIERKFPSEELMQKTEEALSEKREPVPDGRAIVDKIAEVYQVSDVNRIKPGIGETTRVLLRRIPWKIIVNEKYQMADELSHIFQLAEEKGVPCEISQVELGRYKVCGLIRKIADL